MHRITLLLLVICFADLVSCQEVSIPTKKKLRLKSYNFSYFLTGDRYDAMSLDWVRARTSNSADLDAFDPSLYSASQDPAAIGFASFRGSLNWNLQDQFHGTTDLTHDFQLGFYSIISRIGGMYYENDLTQPITTGFRTIEENVFIYYNDTEIGLDGGYTYSAYLWSAFRVFGGARLKFGRTAYSDITWSQDADTVYYDLDADFIERVYGDFNYITLKSKPSTYLRAFLQVGMGLRILKRVDVTARYLRGEGISVVKGNPITNISATDEFEISIGWLLRPKKPKPKLTE